MNRIWEIKQSQDAGVVNIYIYGEVEDGGGLSNETSANSFRAELCKYPDAKQIQVYINSNGGDVFEGVAIHNQLKRHPAKKTVYVDGVACSIASVIAMAGDRVVMPKSAMLMIHNPWCFASGNADELRKIAHDLEQIGTASRQAYLEKAGDKLTEEKLVQLMDAETWLTAEQAVAYGLADEIIGNGNDQSVSALMLCRMQARMQHQAREPEVFAVKEDQSEENKTTNFLKAFLG